MIIIIDMAHGRTIALVLVIGLIVENLLAGALSLMLSPISFWFMERGFLNWFILILFIIGGFTAVFGGLFGTFIGHVMYYSPFGYAKARNASGTDGNDNKLTDTGLPIIIVGIIILVESVIIGLTIVY